MTQLDVCFDDSPWRAAMEAIPVGGTLSAAVLLTLTEELDEPELYDAFSLLEERRITLTVEDLPPEPVSGEAGRRLELERRLVAKGSLLTGLEETDPLRLYLEELAGIPAAGDEELLAQCYRDGEEHLGESLANLSLSRVVELAQEMTGKGVLLLDLIQEGSLGLWQGISCFQGGSFREHRDWWIRQYLARAVTMQSRSCGLGQKLRQGMEDYRDMDQALLSQLGRNPTMEEIGEALHITPEQAAVYASMLEAARTRKKIQDSRELRQEESAEQDQAVENTAYYQSRQRIEELLQRLTPQQAELVSMRFGLSGQPPKTPQQVGAVLGMTPEEVVQQEAQALQLLRQQGEK